MAHPDDNARIRPSSPHRELVLFLILAALGTAAIFLSVKIPHTDVLIEGRWAFGYLGIALLRRWWLALLLAGVLCIPYLSGVPFVIGFFGNLAYTLPSYLVIRWVYADILSRTRSLWTHAFLWFLLVLFCYQAFNTPIIWAILAMLEGSPVLPAILEGWRLQPFFVESVLVAIVSAAMITAIRSHEELEQSRRELAITLDSIGDGVIATDAAGHVVRMNPQAQKLTGWRLDDAQGKPLEKVFRIFVAHTMEPAGNPVHRVMREGVVVGLANHTILEARDGTRRQIADSAAPVFESDGRLIGTVMVFRDVSEEYEARELLTKKEEMLSKSQALAHIGSWELEGATRRLVWSDEVYRIFGLTPQEFEATYESFLEHVHPDDRQTVDEAYSGSIRKKEGSYEIEHRIVRKETGEVRIIFERCEHEWEDDGTFVRSLGLVQDITDRKQAEEKQKRLHDRFLTVLGSIDATIYVADMETHEILFMNERMKEAFCGDFTGKTCWKVFRDEGKPCSCCTNPRLLDEAGRPRGVIAWEDKNPVTARWYNNYDRAIRWVDGRLVRLQIATDITDQKKMEEERRNYEDKLQQMEKMESIGRLAGGVAHDLNNLLSPIIGYSELLIEDPRANSSTRESANEIVSAGYRARDLVRQLLAFSRKQPLEFKNVNLNDVLKDFEKLLRRTLREDVEIHFALADNLPFIQADEGQLEQVVMNLASNAQDAMPSGGTMTLESRVVELDEDYAKAHVSVKPGRFVMFAVTDTGDGMDESTLERLFEPFFTTKEQGRGTGLGLATVYGIVKQHGGNIWVYSEPGEGTTFKCYFPVAESADEFSEKDESKDPVDLRGDETIMVVEDNESVRKMIVSVLERQGYTVLSAVDGKSCIDKFKSNTGDIELLLTDVVMPDMNGRELFANIKSQSPYTKVIYASGYTDDVIAHHGVLDEGIDFLQKPFSVSNLIGKVREVLER
jgi:PAS domain S-box-containing protein